MNTPCHCTQTKTLFHLLLQLPLQRFDDSILFQSKELLPFQYKHSLTLCGDLKNCFPVINNDKSENNVVKDAGGGGGGWSSNQEEQIEGL